MRILKKFLLIAPALALLGAFLLGDAPAGAQGRPVDLELSITNRHEQSRDDGLFVVSVLNRSDVAFRDIRVQLEAEDIALGRTIFLGEFTTTDFPANDGVVNYDTLEWTIPALSVGARATTHLRISDRRTLSTTEDSVVRLQGRIVKSTPREDPGSLGNNQARHFAEANRLSPRMFILFENNVSYGVDADPATDTFAIKVTNPDIRLGAWRFVSTNQHQLRLKVTPSQGLGLTATAPAGTTFDAATGIWDIGTLTSGAGNSPTGNRQMDIRVTGRDARAGPPEEQCLTVEIEHVIPDYTQALLPVTACMAHNALITGGDLHVFNWQDCLAGGDYPCGSQPSLELTAVRWAYDEIAGGAGRYAVGEVHRARFRSDDLRHSLHNFMILQPGEVVLRVPDWHVTREVGSGNNVWSTVDLFDLYMAHKNLEDAGGWTDLKVSGTVTAPGGGRAPGSWALRSHTGQFTFFTATDDTKVESITYQVQQTGADRQFPIRIEFGELGTYVALFEIEGTKSGTKYTDSGVYTFHVGPVAELEVVSASQTPEVVEITAVNNGPDDSLGARAVLTTGQTCEFGGVFPPEDLLRLAGQPATRTCVIPGVELTEAQLAGTEPIGHIENHVDYTVCIDGNGRDVRPKPDGGSACQSEGGTWHAGNVYDYLDSNNDIYLSQEPPPAVDLQPARSRTVTYLTWTRLEELFDSPVSHYQVERLDDGEWASRGSVPQPEDPGEDPEYVDTDKDRGPSPRYRVRAVNEDGLAGAWVESGGPAQPGVVLALDPDTIKEPDADSPGAVTTATVTATLTGAVSSQDITVVVSAEPATGGNPAEPNDFAISENRSLTIRAGSRESTGVVTITANEDADGENERVSITAVASHARPNIRALTLTIDDDDNPGLTLGPLNPAHVPEGGTATYTVKLDAQPSGDVAVRLTSNNTEVAVDTDTAEDGPQNTLTFTPDNWNTGQTVTVSASHDADAADDTASVTHRASGAAEYGSVRASLAVTVDDDDTAGVTVEADSNLTVMEDGLTSVQYLVKLDTEPAGNVVITATGSDPDAASVSPASFTLNRSSWERGQTVTVRARADTDAAYETVNITHAIDAGRTSADEYDGVGVAGVSVRVIDAQAPADYDMDDDGLLEIANREQLDAIRWDLDGNGKPDAGPTSNEAKDYARAFPRMMAGSCGDDFVAGTSVEGDPNTSGTPCAGYELANDIALSGNWTPIGGFRATLKGNGHTISGLSISRPNDDQPVGMFAYNGGTIENLGLLGVNVQGNGLVGALAGQNGGTITGAWVTGSVYGHSHTGGLVGFNRGTVERSYSEAAVTGVDSQDSSGPLWSVRISGLVGLNRGMVRDTYVTGAVRGAGHVSGLVGWNEGNGRIVNSYAAGSVTSAQGFPTTGGLVGWQTATVTNSYWDTEETGQKEGAGQGGEGGMTGLTTKEMKELTASGAGWDGSVWEFGTSGDYPCLVGVTPGCEEQTSQANRASVTVTADDPVAANEGGSAAYTVVLDGQPTGNVVVAMSSDNADVAAQPASLTFTTGNWQTAQTVTVNAAHDGDAANDAATISHSASGANEYAGIDVASVNVAVTDDDTAGVTVSESSLNINEGGSATYTVVLDTQPIADVDIYPFDCCGVTAQPGILTFTPDNWQTPQTVTVSAAQDENTVNEQVVINHGTSAAAESAYASVTIASVSVSVTDDDQAAEPAQAEPPGVVVSAADPVTVREGGTASYQVSLDSAPAENVVVELSSDNGDVTATSTSLTFTADNWQTAQTVILSAAHDDDKADEQAVITHRVGGESAASVNVSVTDDDSDREVLRDFYDATGGDSWTNSANWLSDRPLSEWHGVTLDGEGRVTAIVLDENNLTGSLPAELGKLDSLTRLALNRNGLSGAIPPELGGLSNLSIIGLARNSLSGDLPTELGNLGGLTRLSLHDNTGLTGALPDGFVNITGLQRLAVANTGVCAPDTEAFREWLDSVPDKPGGVQTCQGAGQPEQPAQAVAPRQHRLERGSAGRVRRLGRPAAAGRRQHRRLRPGHRGVP